MADNTTVVVRHFPPSFTKEERVEFMKTFNATEVKCLISKFKKQSLVFAKFKTRREAEAVIKHLHQAELEDGFFLSLEFARGSENSNFAKDFDSASCAETKDDQSSQQHRIIEDFLNRLNSWSRHLDLRHPPPHHLSYQYPQPTLLVLTNIAKALATVPKFYTQVLHLMNKMCLPCPFTENYKITSDLVPDLLLNLYPGVKMKTEVGTSDAVLPNDESCEESEIESDPDTSVATNKAVAPKRTLNPSGRPKAKRLRLVKHPSMPKQEKTGTLIKPEEVFELTSQNPKSETKKIEVKVVSDLTAVAANSNEQEIVGVGFEKIEPTEKTNTKGDEDTNENMEKDTVKDNNQLFITEEELSMNRVSSRDQLMLPVFKNYQPGLPSCRLYLKNLAKNVEQSDLSYIYRRYYLEKEDEQGTMFDIRLMQEGRMKGQAFITLQNEKQAEVALKETNGYILKGKPIVVQFARAKPK